MIFFFVSSASRLFFFIWRKSLIFFFLGVSRVWKKKTLKCMVRDFFFFKKPKSELRFF